MIIEEILSELGYKLAQHGNYYSTQAVYRQGSSPTSLTIYPKSNVVIDWVTGERFNIESLVRKTLNLPDLNHAKKWLEIRNINLQNTEKPEPMLTEPKTFPLEWLNELKPDHSYWLNRGISKEVLEELKGGIATDKIPRMKGRYCFSIWNSKNQLIGLQGRSLDGKNPRYKIIGEKSMFAFPLHVNKKDIKQKSEIILVEGVGCLMSLMSANIRNSMCLFGVSLSNHQLSTIIGLSPQRIIISTNNDGKAGNEAAQKIQFRLLKFFDKKQVEIKLPYLKDINLMLTQTGVDSIKNLYAT